jgi:hypothetical protein
MIYLCDAVSERWSLHQLQHERLDAVGVFETVDRSDVRMIERRQDLRFALETGEAIRIDCELWRNDFQRNVPI